METRINVMQLSSMAAFISVRGGVNRSCKDVYFLRCTGHDSEYLSDINQMDRQMDRFCQSGKAWYQRITAVPVLTDRGEIDYYLKVYENWGQSGKRELRLKRNGKNSQDCVDCSAALLEVQRLFMQEEPKATESMVRNFSVKLLFWADQILGSYFKRSQVNLMNKLVMSGRIGRQEYLFGYFAVRIGIDVLFLLPEGELKASPKLLELSACLKRGENSPVRIPEYRAQEPSPAGTGTPPQGAVLQPSKTRAVPVSASRPKPAGSQSGAMTSAPGRRENRPVTAPAAAGGERRELSFEELAALASSVVMITIHERSGEVAGTGSGIMVGESGYVLTNFHVVSRGSYFSVRIEDDDTAYETDEIIKYNQVLDLALIRIDRRLRPIPIYQSAQGLARGQRVVAIGSPLGLFNSVSDGIISGFRMINDVEMIQFTAPISPGSSGGAVLNMHGEVIGISTAGIESGQNINLAVDYRQILPFIKGFFN